MQKKITKHFFLYAFFILSVFSLFSQTTFSQNQDISLLFPYKINFTESEIQLLKSLDQATLTKFILIAKNILEKNLQAASSTTATINASQPTVYSNSYSPQTPNYNSQTGQYQSRPVGQENSGSISGSSGTSNNNNSGGQSSNPYLPSSGGQSGGQQGNPFLGNGAGQPQLPPSPAAAAAQGFVSGLSLSDVKDIDMKDIDPMCKPNFGVDVGGSCPDIQGATAQLKNTTMKACTIIKKRLKSVSVKRSSDCNSKVGGAGSSQHVFGKAIDLQIANLSSDERVKVFGIFKLNKFEGVGCYGLTKWVHFDHGPARRWYEGTCPPELKQAGY